MEYAALINDIANVLALLFLIIHRRKVNTVDDTLRMKANNVHFLCSEVTVQVNKTVTKKAKMNCNSQFCTSQWHFQAPISEEHVT